MRTDPMTGLAISLSEPSARALWSHRQTDENAWWKDSMASLRLGRREAVVLVDRPEQGIVLRCL